MEFIIDEKKKLAQVWMSHADQNSVEKELKLQKFIADCRAKKIFVCVYRSGDADLLETTKELIAYNYNNSVNRSNYQRVKDEAR